MLESYVSKRRDCNVALKILKNLLSKCGTPTIVVTDKLCSYGVALRDLGIRNRHETGQYQNNQVESSHLNFRRENALWGAFDTW
ncbi:DDE-type integrase/transposase/recombinase [Ahrensia sp. 13_GOM-1096m]|uniref:DDE-type integrase/transposase/recombinase n=1 Tax=Ahrensia sp. 13_GOM-1096m TaxID=1380380 RepID=UPI001FFE6A36|nr:DDE-type integrase/transposase/recombinase [Ahrensia sp. 13_GOM-1096m]